MKLAFATPRDDLHRAAIGDPNPFGTRGFAAMLCIRAPSPSWNIRAIRSRRNSAAGVCDWARVASRQVQSRGEIGSAMVKKDGAMLVRLSGSWADRKPCEGNSPSTVIVRSTMADRHNPASGAGSETQSSADDEFLRGIARQHVDGAFGPPELIRTDFNGLVIRTIGDAITWWKPTHTFHEFCFEALKITFGQEWLDAQFALPADERHVVAKWLLSYSEQTRRQTPSSKADGQVFHATAVGGTKHAVLLGRDLVYLQNSGKLPDTLLNRLRHRSEFQGAWYEVIVASALMHGGFEIEWLSSKSETHCEFVARHRWTGERVAVEAKSRRHAGILNEQGTKPDELPALAHRNFRDALKKDPAGLPFAVFVDVNMSPSGSFEQAEAQWATHMDAVIASHGEVETSPAKFSVAFCTNFTWHHAPDDPVAGPPIVYRRVPPYANVPVQNDLTLGAIQLGLTRVAAMPPLNL